MPVISRFDGIVLRMYLREKEHNPPHLHAAFGECMGVFSILNGNMEEGDMPVKEQKIIQRFISYYRKELLEMWETQEFKKLSGID